MFNKYELTFDNGLICNVFTSPDVIYIEGMKCHGDIRCMYTISVSCFFNINHEYTTTKHLRTVGTMIHISNKQMNTIQKTFYDEKYTIDKQVSYWIRIRGDSSSFNLP